MRNLPIVRARTVSAVGQTFLSATMRPGYRWRANGACRFFLNRGRHGMPKSVQESAMHRRFAPLFVILLSVPPAMVRAAEVRADSYVVQSVGSTARYSVSSVDYIWYDAVRGRNVPARIYYPSGSSTVEKFPAIIFSTGLGRSRDDCAYLGRHWASCGYVSVHVQHKGSDEAVRQGSLRPKKELQHAFYSPQNIRNRPMDLIFVIDQLEQMHRTGSTPGDRIDLARIGVSGHDFGAQTVLALAGQVLPGQLTITDPRVKAVVAMSSPVPLGQVPLDQAYANISRPCLHITGTADNSIVGTTQASQRRLPFDHTSGADQYLVTLYGADHMTYSGHARAANAGYDAMFHRLIAECSAVFWDAYLKDDAGARAWLTGNRIQAHLGGAGWVEQKPAADRTAGK
jgi:predicted dienelactone hydrolase